MPQNKDKNIKMLERTNDFCRLIRLIRYSFAPKNTRAYYQMYEIEPGLSMKVSINIDQGLPLLLMQPRLLRVWDPK